MEKNLKLLAVVSTTLFLANLGYGAAWPYLPAGLVRIGGGLTSVALIMSIYNAFSATVQVPAGRLADRPKVRRVLAITGQLGSGAALMSMAVAATPILFLSLRATMGAMYGLASPSINALISSTMPGSSGTAFGISNFFANLGFFLGNLLGSRMVELGIPRVFLGGGSLIVASAIPLIFAEPLAAAPGLSPGRGERPFRIPFEMGGLGLRGLLPLLLASTLIFTSSGMVYSYLPLYYRELFGEANVGLIFSAGSATTIAAVAIFGRLQDIHGKEPYILVSAILYVLVYLGYSAVREMGIMMVVEAVSGLKFALAWNGLIALASDIAPKGREASALGAVGASASVGWTLGPLIGSLLAPLGFRAIFLSAALVVSSSIPIIIKFLIKK